MSITPSSTSPCYTSLLPHPRAMDNEWRLECLRRRLLADEIAVTPAVEAALTALGGVPATAAHVVCLCLIARSYAQGFDYAIATQWARTAVQVSKRVSDPLTSSKALNALGIVLMDSWKFSQAICAYTEAFHLAELAGNAPQQATLLNNIGLTLHVGGQLGLAHECLVKGIRLHPSYPTVWGNYAHLLFEIGRAADAISAASRCIFLTSAADPCESASIRLDLEALLALIFFELEDVDNLFKHARFALDLAEQDRQRGKALAGAVSLLLDCYKPSWLSNSTEKKLNELTADRRSASLYRFCQFVAIAVLRRTSFHREALNVVTSVHTTDLSTSDVLSAAKLPVCLDGGKSVEIGRLGHEQLRTIRSSLLLQIARSSTLPRGRLEQLLRLAIQAEMREDDLRSSATHVYRVSRLSALIAEEAACTSDHVEIARLAGLLHDVGKVAIPDRVVQSSLALSVEERAQIHRHSQDGSALIELVSPGFRMVAKAVLHHHERWNGSGYPHRLSGEAIPIASRIVALADAFDSMTHWRCYRGARSTREALDEIESGMGELYDPSLAQHLVRLIGRLESETKNIEHFLAEEADNWRWIPDEQALIRLIKLANRNVAYPTSR